MMQPVNANGVHVTISTQPVFYVQNKQLPYTNMRKDLSKQLTILGSMQIGLGVLSVTFEAVSLGLTEYYNLDTLSPVGYGFWTGIMFIITGVFGIHGGRQRSRCSVIAFNMLSIISAFLAVVLFCLSIPSALIYWPSQNYYVYGSRSSKYSYNKDALNAGIAMESLMATAAVFEGIVAIWSSVVCCEVGACCCDYGGDCCCPTSSAPNQIMMTAQPFAGQPVTEQQPYIVFNGYNQQQPYIVGNGYNQQQPCIVCNGYNQQQPCIAPNGYNQQQPVVMSNQPPMYHPVASDQQPVVNPDDQNVARCKTSSNFSVSFI